VLSLFLQGEDHFTGVYYILSKKWKSLYYPLTAHHGAGVIIVAVLWSALTAALIMIFVLRSTISVAERKCRLAWGYPWW
jgi:hypothetical protein